MEACDQNISRTAWARIMMFGLQIVSNMYMTWLISGKILVRACP